MIHRAKKSGRKGYKTTPSIRIPKHSVTKLHAAAAAAARDLEAEKLAHSHTKAALRGAVKWIDVLTAGTKADWTHDDTKSIERLRFLSL